MILKKSVDINKKFDNRDTPYKDKNEKHDSVIPTSKKSAKSNKDNGTNITNNQEVDVPNIGKPSSSKVCENDVTIETSNRFLTTENRKVDKMNKVSNRKTRKKEKKTSILGDSIVKGIEGWRLNRLL